MANTSEFCANCRENPPGEFNCSDCGMSLCEGCYNLNRQHKCGVCLMTASQYGKGGDLETEQAWSAMNRDFDWSAEDKELKFFKD